MPRQCNGGQRIEIQLGVETGGGKRLMTKQIGYVFKADSRIHHLTRYGVTEKMSATPGFSRKTRLKQPPMNELTYSRCSTPRPMWWLCVKENGAISTGWPSELQVRCNGSADFFRQGQYPITASLPGNDANYTTMPIQVVES